MDWGAVVAFRTLSANAWAAVLLGLWPVAQAATYHYQGSASISHSSGQNCGALNLKPQIELLIADDGKPDRFDGYVLGDLIAHLSGSDLRALRVIAPGGPAELSEHGRINLDGVGSGALHGWMHAEPVPPSAGGCYVDDAQFELARTNDADPAHTLAAVRVTMRLLALLARSDYPSIVALGPLVKQIGEPVDGKLDSYQILPWAIYGGALVETGQAAEAEPALRHAIDGYEQQGGGRNPREIQPLRDLGRALTVLGKYAESERLLRRAIALATEEHVEVQVTAAQIDLAALLSDVGRNAEAEPLAREAVARAEQNAERNPVDVARSGGTLANILTGLGRLDEAEPYRRRAVEIRTRIQGPRHIGTARAMELLANNLILQKKYDEAAPFVDQVISIYEASVGEDSALLVMPLQQRAILRVHANQDEAARADLEHALVLAERSGTALVAPTARRLMMYYSRPEVNQLAPAIFYGKVAVNELQRLRGNISSDTGDAGADGRAQDAFVGQWAAAYRRLAQLLIRAGRLGEAQQVLAMLKEEELYDFTQRGTEADPRRTRADLTPSEQALAASSGQIVALQKEQSELRDRKIKDHGLPEAAQARLTALNAQLTDFQGRYQKLLADIAQTPKGAAQGERDRAQSLGIAFQETVKRLGHDAALAQYIVLDDQVAILLTTRYGVVARSAPIGSAELYAQIQALREVLTYPRLDPRPQASKLYAELIGPISADLQQAGAKTLMLSLDDTLRYLPFAALYDGQHYLVENYSLAIFTEAAHDKLEWQPKTEWNVWGLGVTKAQPGFAALPSVGSELNAITGTGGVVPGTVMLDAAFSRQALAEGVEEGYRVIHIASHFKFAPGNNADSFLVLGDGTHASLEDIKTDYKFTDVELLALSACETGLGGGGEGHGAEVESLGSIAQQLGAWSVLATLWPVADASTAELMKTLYSVHATQRLTKADSLRAAQLALLHGTAQTVAAPVGASTNPAGVTNNAGATNNQDARGAGRAGGSRNTALFAPPFTPDPKAPYSHPYYWAPFVLMGNWL